MIWPIRRSGEEGRQPKILPSFRKSPFTNIFPIRFFMRSNSARCVGLADIKCKCLRMFKV